MYVLWLASWFPNKTSPYNGDFIARHAIATSLYCDIIVLHAVKDLNAKNVRVEEKQLSERCKQITIYYPRTSSVPGLEKFFSVLRFIYLQIKMIRRIFRLRGKPALVHLHIIMNEGMIALILKRFWGIPYLVSEQATHYLPEDHDPYIKRSLATNWLIKSVLANTSGVTTVSRTLSEAMKRFNGNMKPVVIPNVVDTKSFYLPAVHARHYPFKLIHVSNFFPQKNTEDILAAFKLLQVTNPGEFSLTMAGGYPADPVEQQEWEANGVDFIGTMDQYALADKMRGSNALILYSHYETFGCVLIEAMACGLPVIVADIGVFHENVKENFNGIFAPPDDPPKLAEKIRELKLLYEQFNKEHISRYAREIYSFERVGKSFHELYNTIAEV